MIYELFFINSPVVYVQVKQIATLLTLYSALKIVGEPNLF